MNDYTRLSAYTCSGKGAVFDERKRRMTREENKRLAEILRQNAEFLEIASQRLFTLNGFKKCLEVPFSEAAATFALDDLVENRGAVFHGTGKDLQHVAFVVPIDENTQLFQLLDGLINVANAILQLGVVGVGNREELNALLFHFRDGSEDVIGSQGDVLNAGTTVEVQIFLDL